MEYIRPFMVIFTFKNTDIICASRLDGTEEGDDGSGDINDLV